MIFVSRMVSSIIIVYHAHSLVVCSVPQPYITNHPPNSSSSSGTRSTTQPNYTPVLIAIGAISLLRRQRLAVPDLLSIFLNTAIATEEAHASHTSDALLEPGILVLVRLINQLVCFDVAIEVVGDEVIVAMVNNAVAQCGEATRVTEHIRFDGFEDFGKVGVKLERAVVVGMTEIFNIFC